MSLRRFQTRCLILCSAIVAGLSLLSVRLVQIQAWDRKHLKNKANQTFERREILVGLRGTIVDRNEEILAKSMPVASVHVDLKHLCDPGQVSFALAVERLRAERGDEWDTLDSEVRRKLVYVERGAILKEAEDLPEGTLSEKAIAQAVNLLARPLGMKREEMHARLHAEIEKAEKRAASRSRAVVTGEFCLVKDRPADDIELVRELISKHWLEGFYLRETYKRWYPSQTTASHVIGYTGETVGQDESGEKTFRQTGKFGIEAAMESYLSGRDGWQEHRRAPNGARIPGDTASLKPPRAGLNVQLTLDMGAQAIAEEELDAGLAEWKASKGCIVVMDPKTGEILAMASRPNFNLNLLKDLDKSGMNFALQATYEPGSTIKIVPASGALNERLVTPRTSIFCHHGSLNLGKYRVPDHASYGYLTVEGILQKSSNIGSYKMAVQLGMDRYYGYLADYGFGRRSGILLSGESGGILWNSKNPMDFSRTAYGYALTVTPLQIASAYCVVAHDGNLRKPHVVKSVIANDGTVVEDYGPEVVQRVIRPETARAIRGALEKVVDVTGTARLAAVPGYRAAGKTGTAVRNENGHYQKGRYVTSFAGMLPAEDPAFVCVVVIDDPRMGEKGIKPAGGTVGAPIFAKVAERLAAHLNLPPTEPVEEKDPSNIAASRNP